MSASNFVICISTVNGTGSQSANSILLKSLFRMGVPVGGKNVFPSNIAGLPTWFWIRANDKGFTSQTKKTDVLVNLNPSTIKADLAIMNSGGFLFTNAETVVAPEDIPAGVKVVPVPFKKLSEEATSSIKVRKLVANMVYVGVLCELLQIPDEVAKAAIGDQLGKKASVLESNMKAFELGQQFARENLKELNFTWRAKGSTSAQGKILIDGNTSAALGLAAGGCSFVSWYPITPSTSLVDAFNTYAPQLRKDKDGKNTFAIVQSEDELAAIGMVLGAGWAGARAMTATSGPGVSLMSEAAGYAYYAEVPAVIWDVQRVGPSTGMPTRTAQGDLLTTVLLSHGDTKHPVLIPGTVTDCFEFGKTCFDLSETLQQMVFVLSDLDLGMNLWTSEEFKLPTEPLKRGKVLSEADFDKNPTFERYKDVDGDAIPYRTIPGNKAPGAAYFTRGSGHNAKGQYTENAAEYVYVMDRLARKWDTAKTLVPKPIIQNSGNKAGLLYYGTTEAIINETLEIIGSKGIKVDTCRVRAVPFTAEVENYINQHDKVYVIDQNRDGQMHKLLMMEYPHFASKLVSIPYFSGTPINAEDVSAKIVEKGL
jgi:2-oxoglutarate/2-oxoacid ferredoxin oxidoreductase subunit alpha